MSMTVPNMKWDEGYDKYGNELLKSCMEDRYNVYIGLRMTAHEKAQQLIELLKKADDLLGSGDCEELDLESEGIKCLISYLGYV